MKISHTFVMLFLLTALGGPPWLISHADGLALTSPQIKEGAVIGQQQVFHGYGCSGGNVSPAFSWSGVPAGTKSLAITAHDPDAPNGWWHWLVVNLPPATRSLPLGAGSPGRADLPAGSIQIRTDFGTPGYGGPCPPSGDAPHHYHFTVYALDVDVLRVGAGTTADSVGKALNSHALATATLTGLYGR